MNTILYINNSQKYFKKQGVTVGRVATFSVSGLSTNISVMLYNIFDWSHVETRDVINVAF